MAVLTYKGGKYRNLAGNKIYDGSKWVTMGGDSKIFLDGKWHDFSWKKAQLPDIPDEPELPDWDDFTHLQTEERTEGTVYYMTPVGSGAKDGSSWSNAFSASQIFSALSLLDDGDRLYMAEGDYGTLSAPLDVDKNVHLCGGFVDGDYTWETRDAFSHPTLWKGNGTFPFASGSGTLNADGVSFEGFIVYADVKLNGLNMTLINSGYQSTMKDNVPNFGVFENCRFSGIGGITIACYTAKSCYFASQENDRMTLLFGALQDSVVAHCSPYTKKSGSDIVGRFAVTIISSTVLDLHLGHPGHYYTSVDVKLCSSATDSTFIRLTIFDSYYEMRALSGCTIVDSNKLCVISIEDSTSTCYFIRSDIYGYFTNSVFYACVGRGPFGCADCKIIECSSFALLGVENTVAVNSSMYSDQDSTRIEHTYFINCAIDIRTPINFYTCLFVNTTTTGTSDKYGEYNKCTIVNSVIQDGSGFYNVFWNSNGRFLTSNNAQSAYSPENALTLGTTNDVTKFVNTGYAPATGNQDVGQCPNPLTDPDGYEEYVASFGDWHPESDSLLIGKGPSGGGTDLDGVVRPSPSTIGCYEPRP